MFTAKNEEWQFTAIETDGTWPQAKKHTQWPGDGPNKGRGRSGLRRVLRDPGRDGDLGGGDRARNQDAGAALLDKIGPAIVLTHSQSGSFGWLIADARPKLVKAIVAIEPAGPPFEATVIGTGRAAPGGRPTSRSPMIRR